MENDLLRKVITTTTLGSAGGGLLAPEQADRFIDYMWDATALGNDARTVRLRANTAEIERIHVGERLVRVATEAVDDHVNANVTFSKISVTTTKLRLDWELSTESLEDGIEGQDLEDHIARLMATQMGNDLEDVAINGDAALSDPLLKAFDGWRKRALAGGRVVDAGGATLDHAVFNSALRAMPRQYKQRRSEMRFYAGSNLVQDYLYGMLTGSPEAIATGIYTGQTPVGPEGPAGGTYPFAFGIPVKEVPLMNTEYVGTYDADPGTAGTQVPAGEHGDLELTFPRNRLWAVKREIVVHREFKPKKDTIEYTVFTRVGVQIENLDAYVVVRNIRAATA